MQISLLPKYPIYILQTQPEKYKIGKGVKYIFSNILHSLRLRKEGFTPSFEDSGSLPWVATNAFVERIRLTVTRLTARASSPGLAVFAFRLEDSAQTHTSLRPSHPSRTPNSWRPSLLALPHFFFKKSAGSLRRGRDSNPRTGFTRSTH